MNIIRRSVPATEVSGGEILSEPAVSRRIEVTVERETVTVLVRGQPSQDREARGSPGDTPEAECPALQPLAPASPPPRKNRR
jgi:hypothetical protein